MGRVAGAPPSWSSDTDAFVLASEHRPSSGACSDAIPVISLRPLFAALGEDLSTSTDWAAVSARVDGDESLRVMVGAVGRACEEWGFFQVVDHGVAPEMLERVKGVAREFFGLPEGEKRRVGRSFDRHLGYNNSELTKNTRDWKEIFDWAAIGYMEMPETVEPDYRSGKYSKTTVKSHNQWPEQPKDFRAACEEYTAAVVHLANLLLGLITTSLGLPFDLFHHCFDGENTIRARLNYYPQCPLADMVCGVNRHVDSGALTVLAQDEVGGLQVKRKDGQWIGVKPCPEAFVVNVGAIFQVWSNDKYPGIEHRVVVNETKERFSIPVFFDPDIRTDVSPAPELLDERHPPRYQPYNWGFFRRMRNNGNFKQLGENIQIHHYAI